MYLHHLPIIHLHVIEFHHNVDDFPVTLMGEEGSAFGAGYGIVEIFESCRHNDYSVEREVWAVLD